MQDTAQLSKQSKLEIDVEDTAQTLNVRDEPPKVANRYEEFNV